VGLGVLWASAFALRLTLLRAHPYGDEAAHFYIARHLATPPDNIHYVYPDFPFLFMPVESVFAQRPVFFLLLAPGALLGFEGFRVLHMALASLLPSVGVLLAQSWGARRWLAYAAGVALVIHPVFVTFGALVFSDTLATLLLAASLLARSHGRPAAAAGLLLAAIWTKEVLLVAAVALFAIELRREWRSGGSVWPLRLGRTASGDLFVLLFGLLPTVASYFLDGLFPGWGRGGDVWAAVDRLLVIPWLLPLLLLGLWWPRTRFPALLALLYPAFYLAYRMTTGRGLAIWHLPLPNFLVLVALAVLLDELLRRSGGGSRRAGARAAVVAVAALLLVQVAAPDAATWKQEVTAPIGQDTDFSLADTIRYNLQRDQDLWKAVQHAQGNESLLAVDVMWFYVLYPLSDHFDRVQYVYTVWVAPAQQELHPIAAAFERAGAVLLHVDDNSAVNRALRGTYSDCASFSTGDYRVYRPATCQGRLEELERVYNESS
jgi:hypothetical protein